MTAVSIAAQRFLLVTDVLRRGQGAWQRCWRRHKSQCATAVRPECDADSHVVATDQCVEAPGGLRTWRRTHAWKFRMPAQRRQGD